MTAEREIKSVGVVGTGVIGASWAAQFLAQGLDVSATDPAPGAEDRLRAYVDGAWPALEQFGLASTASMKRLRFSADVAEALAGVDFVQENGPERQDVKIETYAKMDELLPADVILASSSSGLTMSPIQAACQHPERCVIGHPFNPPHLIPLVEVVGGKETSAKTIETAIRFYTALGKRAIHVRKEVPGHVANRLQAALWREVVHLVEEDVVSVGDVDAAICWGPGLRWGVMGPVMLQHLGAGPEGGIRLMLEHLGGPIESWWKTLGNPTTHTPETKEKLIEGALEAAAGRSIQELEAERDRVLLGLLSLRNQE
jgi:3-hydroxyacyl-CoA dehydrogenase